MERVVVTGLGALTPTGLTAEEFWQACKDGRHGFVPLEEVIPGHQSKVKVVAPVKDFVPKDHLDRKQVKRLDRYTQLAMVAARQAFAQANFEKDALKSSRIGVYMGTGVGGIGTVEEEHKKYLGNGEKFVNPLYMPKWLPNIAAGQIAIDLSLQGQTHTTMTACASGVNAIGEATRAIRHGYSQAILAGGAEACITPSMLAGFANMNAHTASENVDRASIPFDADRSGFVLGEGAGFLMLESLTHAQQRGAHILAEVVGYGCSTDAYHVTSPHPEGRGAVEAMEQALEEAGVGPEAIDYINAHGTSTPQNDRVETLAVKTVFGAGASAVAVSSTKSMIGHLQGAAGAVEAVVCVHALLEGFVPPTVGSGKPDPDCDLDYVLGQGRHQDLQYVMNNGFGFGGHNGSLVFKKADF